MFPDSEHNEALADDTLYSVSFNYQWRRLIVPVLAHYFDRIALEIEDESERQTFEERIGYMLLDFYTEDIVDNTPVGTIAIFPKLPVPDKWLLCEGQLINQADYPELYALIGDTYTSPPSETQFRTPQLAQKFVRGINNSGTPGSTIGEDTHVLGLSEIPAHTHTIAHTHTVPQATTSGAQVTRLAPGNNSLNANVATSAASTPDSGSAGGGLAHNNIPSAMHLAYMIKALP